MPVILLAMAQISGFSAKQDDGAEDRAKKFARAMQDMLDALTPAERETVIRMLSESIQLHRDLKPANVLGTIVRLLPRSQKWTVEEIKRGVEERGVKATDKQVFNAVGYLTRKGRIKRIGYGRYVVDGMAFVGADDLGGQPSITEGDLDD